MMMKPVIEMQLYIKSVTAIDKKEGVRYSLRISAFRMMTKITNRFRVIPPISCKMLIAPSIAAWLCV